MQLFLFIPFQVIAIKRSKLIGTIVSLFLIASNMIINAVMTLELDLKVGLLNINNVNMYYGLVNKPYYHFAPHSMGVLFAFFYLYIREYEKYATDSEYRKTHFKILYFLYRPRIVRFLAFFAQGIIIAYIFMDYPAMQNPGLYTNSQNAAYYATRGVVYTVATGILLFCYNTGMYEANVRVFSSVYFRVLGRLTYIATLFGPVIFFMFSFGAYKAIYITYYGIVHIHCGLLISMYLSAILIYLLIEYPFQKVRAEILQALETPRS